MGMYVCVLAMLFDMTILIQLSNLRDEIRKMNFFLLFIFYFKYFLFLFPSCRD